MPWMRWGPGLPARQHRRALRLDRHHPQSRVALAQILADAGDRAPGSHAGDEHVHAAVQRPLDLRARRAPVGLRVGGVRELVGQEHVVLARHRARGLDGLAHAAERLGDVHARAIQPQQALALAAHALRQRQHQVIALGGAHERQRDPRVAARRLDDRRAPGLDPAFGLGGLDHRHADAVLDAAARVERLELGEQLDAVVRGGRALEHLRKPDQRRAPDELRNVDRDFGHRPDDNSGRRGARGLERPRSGAGASGRPADGRRKTPPAHHQLAFSPPAAAGFRDGARAGARDFAVAALGDLNSSPSVALAVTEYSLLALVVALR